MAVNRVGRCAVGVVNPERLAGRHFVDYIPSTEKKSAPARMCVVCCSKRDDRKSERKPDSIVLIVTSDFVQSHVSKYFIPGMFTKPICSV
ncbi:Hypothetical predicted protein [Pelobates cultripes]|uniref:Uncharacterized protein n=1 Tax=Pelobates cultripes TaxID=61616 RepID=A0AAD1VYB1_PELCU|nr:Hypothetical predicted protein [Pelobates cultripes]